MLDGNTKFVRKYIWKLKVPLKIRIFMWFLQRKVILTKDNLLKRNWQGATKCCFCEHEETIQHLFFDCPFTKVLWRIVHLAFNITPPKNTTNLFGNWLNRVNKKDKEHIRVGVCDLLWAIWHVRNNFIFNKSSFPSFMQSLWHPTGSVHGPFSFLRTNAMPWILGAPV